MTQIGGSHASPELPVLLFFRSESSGPARRMDSVIAHFSHKERGRLRVQVVDVDEAAELVQRFRIETVPTLVLVTDGRIAGRLEGRVSAPKISRLLELHLLPLSTETESLPAFG